MPTVGYVQLNEHWEERKERVALTNDRWASEGMCAKLGKVRRIKFYKDERGGLKVRCVYTCMCILECIMTRSERVYEYLVLQGDATVTFASHAAMRKAIERVMAACVCASEAAARSHNTMGWTKARVMVIHKLFSCGHRRPRPARPL